jgi:uncharacterized protein
VLAAFHGLAPELLLLCALAFFLGGLVKGTLGIGLPLVALPLLSLGWPAVQAMALLAAPVLLSNIWQAWDSGISARGVRRFAPLLATLALATLATVPMTLALSDATLRTVLACVVLLAVTLNALPLKLTVPPAQERWWSAGVGAVSGVMGGVSALTGPVIISYLVSLRLPRDVFVGTISVIYLCGSVPLYASMAWQGRITALIATVSMLALLPMALGLHLGRRVRHRLSEALFRRLLLAFLALLALLLMLR